MIERLRFLSFCLLLGSVLIANPVLADYQPDDGESGCGRMLIQYGSDSNYPTALSLCTNLTCDNVCGNLGCGCSSGCSSAASGCSQCPHESAWMYRAHGTCNCEDLN
jgi:hypothetical protein